MGQIESHRQNEANYRGANVQANDQPTVAKVSQSSISHIIECGH